MGRGLQEYSAYVRLLSGPVRGVHFHPSRPLLVTGGDDYKIKVWGTFSTSALVIYVWMLTRSRHTTANPKMSFHAAWPPRLCADSYVPS